MKRVVIAIVLVLAVVLATGASLAAPRPDRASRHGLGPLAHLGLAHVKHELNLTDQQSDRIKAIVAETRKEIAPYRAQLRGGYKGVFETLLDDPNNVAGAQARIEQQDNAEHALKVAMLEGASKALAVLTPEQREKLGTMLEKHAARHGR